MRQNCRLTYAMYLKGDAVRITVPMFEKGRCFVMAGGLVKAYEGHRFVYLHLLCQGLECIGKALLLAHNYEKYERSLQKDFGHDLEVLVAEIDRNSGSTLLSPEASEELNVLNSFYKRHLLRYGDGVDFQKESGQIRAAHLHRKLVDSLTELNRRFSSNESGAY